MLPDLIVFPVFVSIILIIYSDASGRLSQVQIASSSLQKGGEGIGVGGTLHAVGWLLLMGPVPQAFIAFTVHSYVSPDLPGNSNFVNGAWTVPDLMIFLLSVSTTVILYPTAFDKGSHVQADCVALVSEQALADCKSSVEALPRSSCWFWISLTVKNTPISSIITRRAMPALFVGTELFFIGTGLDLVYSKGIEF